MGMIFNRGALGLQDGSIVWSSATIKARLSRTSENAISKDATVMTGLGIAATDITLGTKTGPTEDQATDRIKYSSANPSFAAVASGAEVDKLIIFKFVTNDAASIPIAVVSLTTPITPNGGDINVTWDAQGAFYTQQ
jgi:hypothetical protein